MSKFLKLVEENRPGEDKYTVELRDVNGDIIDSFDLFGVGSPFEIFDSFKQEYAPDIPVEDQEIKTGPAKYDVDKEVNRLANQGGMFSGAGKAKKALKQRQKVAKDAIAVYDKKTKELQTAVRDAANPPKTP
tara:strand:+ start:240 stop:635 length:396 start_codon:yes stop_codon:yes gene_type:complete